MNAAVDDQLIGRNPLKAQSVKVPKQPPSRAEPWTTGSGQGGRAGLSARWQAVADCGAGLGLRQREIFGLAVDDMDFLRRKVHVRRQVKRVGNRAWFALPKGSKERTVPLAQHVAVALAQHIEQHPAAEVTLPWNEPRYRLDADQMRVSARSADVPRGPGAPAARISDHERSWPSGRGTRRRDFAEDPGGGGSSPVVPPCHGECAEPGTGGSRCPRKASSTSQR